MANYCEIERKFKVANDDYKKLSYRSEEIIQGYLSSTPERTVRVRIKGDKGYITIKGMGNGDGTTRFEWEKEISIADARQLLTLCEPGIIEKIRYCVKVGEHIFEVDEFRGDNEGLVIAEIELSNENEPFEHPEWLGEEVTGQKQFYNAWLSKCPYKDW